MPNLLYASRDYVDATGRCHSVLIDRETGETVSDIADRPLEEADLDDEEEKEEQ